MSTTYNEVLSRVRHLTAVDQLRLLEALSGMVRRQLSDQPRRSILDLQGLGKEIWAEVDAQTYVDQERASWDG
jgi:hypothetical protein